MHTAFVLVAFLLGNVKKCKKTKNVLTLAQKFTEIGKLQIKWLESNSTLFVCKNCGRIKKNGRLKQQIT